MNGNRKRIRASARVRKCSGSVVGAYAHVPPEVRRALGAKVGDVLIEPEWN